jgi:hypothetical protein
MENSKYDWIHKNIVENLDVSPEFTLLDLKEKLNGSLDMFESRCGTNWCRGRECITCANRINIDYVRKHLNELTDFAKENEIDIKSYEERRKRVIISRSEFKI